MASSTQPCSFSLDLRMLPSSSKGEAPWIFAWLICYTKRYFLVGVCIRNSEEAAEVKYGLMSII